MTNVTVIIPARIKTDQQFRWLLEAVKSADRNRSCFEIVVGMDSLLTGTQRIDLHSLSRKLHIAFTESPSSGAGAARNVAAHAATGEYLLPLDADDTLLPDSIDLLLEHADPKVAVYGDVEYIGDKIGTHKLPEYDLNNLLRLSGTTPVTMLYAKSAWQKTGGYDETLTALEDVDFALRLATHGIYGYHIPQVTLRYRKHAGSRQATAEKDLTRYQEIRQYLHERYKTLYTRGNMSEPCKTCPGAGGTGNGIMDRPQGLGPNTLMVRYDGPMEGQFIIQSWNVRDNNNVPVQYSIQGRGSVLEIDARDRAQFESRFHNGQPQFRFLDTTLPTPPPSLNIQSSLPPLPKLDDLTAADSVKAIEPINDIPDLSVLLAEEKTGKNRKTVVEAIETKMELLAQ